MGRKKGDTFVELDKREQEILDRIKKRILFSYELIYNASFEGEMFEKAPNGKKMKVSKNFCLVLRMTKLLKEDSIRDIESIGIDEIG